jgi:23S rRNA (uracil-5-)-methyltransferase RumA
MTRQDAPLLLQPTALDARGAGLATLEGMRVHVAGVLPGEVATAVLEHVSPHRGPDGRREAWARALELSVRSPQRAAPACRAYGQCGGCLLQHLAYPAQLQWKRDQVAAALDGRGPPVEPCVPSPRVLGYRNQGKYVYAGGAGAVLGGYAPRSHRLVDLEGCRVVEPPIDAVAFGEGAGGLRSLLAAQGVPAFDERRRTGLLRYCVLRSNRQGQVLVTLVTGRPSWPEGAGLARALMAERPQVVGVVWNVNTSGSNVILGPDEELLAGHHLAETLSGVTVEVGSRVFLQLNREVAALIYGQVAEAAAELGPMARVVELYAGVGAMSFAVAPLAAEVVAIEENPQSCAAGTRAAAAAGLNRIRFLTADAGRGLAGIDAADLVILNPPRAGMEEAVAAAVARLRPRLCAYVSCNPASLARDLDRLAADGLRPIRITPFDMLPHTPHVEVLSLLHGRD